MMFVAFLVECVGFAVFLQTHHIPGTEKPATFFRHGQHFLPFALKRYVIASQQIRL